MQLAVFALLALAAVLVQEAAGSTCPYSCTVSYTYQSGTYECGGWWNRRRCARYSTGYRTSTCYRSCTHGGWSAYSEVSRTACTRSCGTGSMLISMRRTCNNPAPYNGGNPCYGSSTKTVSRTCNTHHCPVPGGWSDFHEVDRTECSKSCGGGQIAISMERECSQPPPAYGGSDCQGSSSRTDYEDCNTHHCPIDGKWTPYSDWLDYDECTVLCGGGKKDQFHTRTCTNPPPQYGGEICVGPSLENRTIDCNSDACDSCPEGQTGYLAHPTNKRRYYQCDNGVARRHDCAPGTKFSEADHVCVTDEEQAPSTAAPITHATQAANGCTAGVTFLPHESECSKYYQCSNGRRIERSCAPGLHFDTSINTCNHASLAGCA